MPKNPRQPIVNFLTEEELTEIHFASLEILERTGVHIHHEAARDLLYSAGAYVENDLRVRIPSQLVKVALNSAPERIVIADRLGNRKMFLEGRKVYFGTGSDLKYTIDSNTHERRLSVLKDIEDAALISDFLPNLDFLMSYGLASDVDVYTSDLHAFYAMLKNSVKPVIITAAAADQRILDDIYEIACCVAGGREQFSQKPFFILYGQFISPFVHNREGLERLLFCAEKNIPIIYIPTILAGATGPATMAGAIAVGNAEALVGLVISQLKNPGSPFIYGGCVSSFDMRYAMLPYGAPEWHVASAVLSQLSQRYGLPLFSTGGCTDAKVVDEQAAVEGAYSILLAALSGANLIHDVGYLESGLTGSLDYLVMMDETIGLTRRILENFEVNSETLALDVVHNVGPGGHFFTEDHTLRHYRAETWYPTLMDRRTYEDWSKGGGMTLKERAQEKVGEILNTHRHEPLADDVASEIEEIIQRAESRMTDEM
ncbi:MAG: trimethylamine methyltransferase family protein [Candidatus Poribacteria bacterium]